MRNKIKIICGIYKITSPSGKVYIGSSINTHKRHLEYKNLNCELQFKLYNSLVKYGFKAHKIDIIEECDESVLNCRERYWQDFYDVLNRDKGLNLVLVECGEKRRVFSEEAKRKQGDSQRGGKNHGAVPLVNVLTEEEFECISCVAEKEGYDSGTFHAKLRGRTTNDTPYIFKYDYEKYLKGTFTNVNIIKDRRVGWEVINIVTKEVFLDIKKATENYTDFKYKTVCEWLRKPELNRSPFRYLKNYKEEESFMHSDKKRIKTSNREVLNKNKLLVYNTIREASVAENINLSTLRGRMDKSKHLTDCVYLDEFINDNPDFDRSLFIYYNK